LTKIIDNKRELLSTLLNKEFPSVDEIAIASAYFNVRGYGAIAEGLGDKPARFLLGREPTESIKWEDEILRELEECEDESVYFQLLRKAIEYFNSDKRMIRIVEGRFFHGKAFIGASPSFKEVKNGIGVVGSSNFTYGGLVSNRELNMLNTDREVVQELCDWFEEQWASSRDFKGEFLSMLSNYVTTWSPYEVVAKALYETYKESLAEREVRMLKSMFPHQQLSCADASEKLEKYNGVIIADSTGLGKSMVALALAHNAIRDGKRPLLIAPKSVLETTWKDEMRRLNVKVDELSTEKLSQDPSCIEEYKGEYGPKLIIVDEAHYFRRQSTNRYEALREMVVANGAQVVLVTATPVNTSLMDLYSLMSLYLPEDCIADLGYTLRGRFISEQSKWIRGEPINMDDVLRRFIVRHSRELAKALDREGKIKFPNRLFDEKIGNYKITTELQEVYDELSRLNLTFYDLSIERLSSEFRLPDGTPVSSHAKPEQMENLKKLVKTIFIIGLFKRLESSYAAFSESLRRMKNYIRVAEQYALQYKIFIPPKMRGDILALFGDEEELEGLIDPDELFSKSKYNSIRRRCDLSDGEAKIFAIRCEEDEKIIEKLLSMLPHDDDKYRTLEKRIREIIGTIKGTTNGVIVFTQYADTAHYLYGKLKQAFGTVMLVTGAGGYDDNGKSANEAGIVKRFQKIGGVLVSTDVLSAGQNLQNAQYVVNYDFPWNPVILIQRIGRVDRIGSPYDQVYLVNVLPKSGDPEDPKSLEFFLGLMERLYKRLEMIRSTIGLDASTLGEEAAPKDFSIQAMIAKRDEKVLELLERRIEQFTKDPIDILAKILNEKGLDWVRSLPNGIGTVKHTNFEGLFILLTDGTNFYWRLNRYDNGSTTTSPTEIVDLLMEGESQNRGEVIDYETIVPLLKKAKEDLREELKKMERREITSIGPNRINKTITEIFDSLSKHGPEGERLAAMFRELADRAIVVKQLKKAADQGKLLEEAKKILPTMMAAERKEADITMDKVNLRRICWCYFKPDL
jgi:superfamily II DNA/RNA helicase